MSKKPFYFIYERREVWVLILLGLTVAAFSFTLGIHFGKRVGPKGQIVSDLADSSPAQTAEEQLPDRVQLTEQGEAADEAASESLDETAKDEIEKTQLKLDVKRQVDLPKQAKSGNAGATSITPPAPGGKFTLQVGSYPTLAEAQGELKSINDRNPEKNVEPFLQPFEVKDKGTWYRVYLGSYESKKAAEEIANRFVKLKVIRNFIISNYPAKNESNPAPKN